MFVILPLFSLLLLLLLFQKTSRDWRRSALAAAITWGVVLTGTTEVLSIFRLLTFTGLVVTWSCASLTLGLVYVFIGKRIGHLGTAPAHHTWQTLIAGRATIANNATQPFVFFVCALLSIATISGLVGVIALVAPPNTWDCMKYHMSRVAHWMQNGSVAHYPTHELLQLHMPPGAEYIILHFQVLSGGDRFANLPQWLSMLGSIIGVSLVAQGLGAHRRGQLLAAVVCATLPVGILQASGAKNDYVSAFWLVCLVYYALRWKTQPGVLCSLAAGAGLGLALLTKATAYPFALPFLLWLSLWGLKTLRAKVWKYALLVATTAVLVNSAYYARNITLFHHPLSPGSEELGYDLRNETHAPLAILSRVIRSVALQARTPLSTVNAHVEAGIRSLHDLLGTGIDDPRTTFGTSPFSLAGVSPEWLLDESYAGNLIHLILVMFSSVAACFMWRQRRLSLDVVLYDICVILGILMLCFYHKWGDTETHYYLGPFVLWSPFVAAVLLEVLHRNLLGLVSIVLVVAAFPYVLYNNSRPLVGKNNILETSRTDLYFSSYSPLRTELEGSYLEAARFLGSRAYSQIGLQLYEYEYPIWVLLQKTDSQRVRLQDVDVRNASSVIYDDCRSDTFRPSAVLVFGAHLGDEAHLREGRFVRIWASEAVEIELYFSGQFVVYEKER